MFDPQHLLGTLLNTGTASSSSNFLTRNLGNLGIPGGAAGAAGLALLGGVAVGAFEHFSQRRQAVSPGTTGISPGPSAGAAFPFPAEYRTFPCHSAAATTGESEHTACPAATAGEPEPCATATIDCSTYASSGSSFGTFYTTRSGDKSR